MEDEIRFEITDEVSFEQREENEWDKEETKFFFKKHKRKEDFNRANWLRKQVLFQRLRFVFCFDSEFCVLITDFNWSDADRWNSGQKMGKSRRREHPQEEEFTKTVTCSGKPCQEDDGTKCKRVPTVIMNSGERYELT
ncbi:hypothetical protein SDJN03_25385, partial [Cucurbita argyrosperma subsp. sororia]